jgi:hypothetical protein
LSVSKSINDPAVYNKSASSHVIILGLLGSLLLSIIIF